ncbi:hypothetical protein MIND_00374900 [Mycena indigotica]|uniref:Uncharacterized protein n=1 Tax=Mycena indigotica TaxID=2126181 RepID=A0A8H6T365_9AGAR|nr:uncharacterized protein MIND_00374900 [Mycena indigotica]KAF7310020.1 hypothetical protein MIND_00374900 [Mycena indigotica]
MAKRHPYRSLLHALFLILQLGSLQVSWANPNPAPWGRPGGGMGEGPGGGWDVFPFTRTFTDRWGHVTISTGTTSTTKAANPPPTTHAADPTTNNNPADPAPTKAPANPQSNAPENSKPTSVNAGPGGSSDVFSSLSLPWHPQGKSSSTTVVSKPSNIVLPASSSKGAPVASPPTSSGTSSQSQDQTPSTASSRNHTPVAAIVVPLLFAITVLGIVATLCYRRRRARANQKKWEGSRLPEIDEQPSRVSRISSLFALGATRNGQGTQRNTLYGQEWKRLQSPSPGVMVIQPQTSTPTRSDMDVESVAEGPGPDLSEFPPTPSSTRQLLSPQPHSTRSSTQTSGSVLVNPSTSVHNPAYAGVVDPEPNMEIDLGYAAPHGIRHSAISQTSTVVDDVDGSSLYLPTPFLLSNLAHRPPSAMHSDISTIDGAREDAASRAGTHESDPFGDGHAALSPGSVSVYSSEVGHDSVAAGVHSRSPLHAQDEPALAESHSRPTTISVTPPTVRPLPVPAVPPMYTQNAPAAASGKMY